MKLVVDPSMYIGSIEAFDTGVRGPRVRVDHCAGSDMLVDDVEKIECVAFRDNEE